MTRIRSLAIVVALATAATVLAAPSFAEKADHVDVAGATKLLDADDQIVVLDVRTPGEFDAIHIDGAKNIDVDGETFRTDVAALDRDKTYLVHCAAGIPGGRSERAVEVMQELGFAKVHHLDGGINAWKESGEQVVGTAADAD